MPREPDTTERDESAPRVAIVVAGAAARGAFEAGALSVLVPWLAERGLRPTVFVGTSSGSINAALLAATADLKPRASAGKLLEFWRSLTIRDVFRSPVLSAPGLTVDYVGQLFGQSHVLSLLDTTPLLGFAERAFEPYAEPLRRNIANGRVQALAVAATDAGERTTVFTDLASGVPVPSTNRGRAIYYQPATVGYKHVLASSAIPFLFRPVEVDGRYYTDGGVRLNAPLAPATALGATHIVAVATHPETYPPKWSAAQQQGPPDLVSSIVNILGSVLADRMVEDLHTLDKLNANADGGSARLIRRLFVGPKTRHELGALAAKVYRERYHGRRVVNELDFRLLHALVGAREQNSGELLSYVFFDNVFANASIDLGIRYAKAATKGSGAWEPSGSPAQRPRTATLPADIKDATPLPPR
jgi:NTE family protein